MQIISQADHTFQLSEFRDHCRIPWTDDDPALQRSLDGAVNLWETATGWWLRQTRIRFDAYAGMIIPGGPVPTLVEVYEQIDSVDETDVTASWYLRSRYGSYELTTKRAANNRYNPSKQYRADVQFAGSLTNAVKLGVFDWGNLLFREREGFITGTTSSKMPMTLQSIVQSYQRAGI